MEPIAKLPRSRCAPTQEGGYWGGGAVDAARGLEDVGTVRVPVERVRQPAVWGDPARVGGVEIMLLLVISQRRKVLCAVMMPAWDGVVSVCLMEPAPCSSVLDPLAFAPGVTCFGGGRLYGLQDAHRGAVTATSGGCDRMA